ncbi:hypothetical protein DFH01_20215 [Falsiroseomonas bella]|uniref:Urease accessory protein UreH-like transmembrane domain-containing protein n=1 Tax=Falsiroseomonas bella TaxID=2184016 RepID=A0A317FBM1_9PROT|nr:hypothetical protein [Falsiroseomonas bella]PWS35893.1 hypothetical protein DFH01_20215 [Falsiroseomonas bella]
MDTSGAVLASVLVTGLVVAFLHAAIPTHWLPFVLAARGQGWSRTRTLGVVGFAGAGHVLLTTLLGALLVFAGMQVEGWIGSLFAWIAGGALILIGLFYLWRQRRGGGHGHVHLFGGHAHDHDHDHDHHGHRHDHAHHHDHDHDHDHDHGHDHGHRHDHAPRAARAAQGAAAAGAPARRSDIAVILGLFALLTFSPCEGFLPVYGAGIVFGWWGFLLLSGALALATVAAMVLFTWLTLLGIERLNLGRIEQYEAGIYGALFIGLGLLIIVTEA